MATIRIRSTINDGNLGDGWLDNSATAYALAEYTEMVWLNDCSDLAADGHNISIEIDVHANTSGGNGGPRVDAFGFDDVGIERDVESLLTAESDIWVAFCDSDDAADLME
jgi:hypothetical protein